jgi:hypothetical protein
MLARNAGLSSHRSGKLNNSKWPLSKFSRATKTSIPRGRHYTWGLLLEMKGWKLWGWLECHRENIVFVLFSFPSCPKRVWLLHYTGLYTLHNFFLKLSRARFRRRVVCLTVTQYNSSCKQIDGIFFWQKLCSVNRPLLTFTGIRVESWMRYLKTALFSLFFGREQS